MTYPVNVHTGSGLSLNGAVSASSGSTLTEVAVLIEDAAGNTVMSASASLTGTESSWSLQQVDDQIRFGTLPAGSYTYLIIAEDAAGDSLCFASSFTVSDGPTADGCYWSVQDPEGAMLQQEAPAAQEPAAESSLGSQVAAFLEGLGSLF